MQPGRQPRHDQSFTAEAQVEARAPRGAGVRALLSWHKSPGEEFYPPPYQSWPISAPIGIQAARIPIPPAPLVCAIVLTSQVHVVRFVSEFRAKRVAESQRPLAWSSQVATPRPLVRQVARRVRRPSGSPGAGRIIGALSRGPHEKWISPPCFLLPAAAPASAALSSGAVHTNELIIQS